MPKTKDAFAFRELYHYCFEMDEKSKSDSEKTNRYYLNFLQKGFKRENTNNRAQAAYFGVTREFFKRDRADFVAGIINHHITRLKRFEGRQNISQSRLADLINKYLALFTQMEESALNFGEFGRANQRMFKKIFSQEFGNRLRIARKRAGLSQTMLASKLNISQEGYARYELGAREPPLGLIYELSIVLDVSTDWLFCRIPLRS